MRNALIFIVMIGTAFAFDPNQVISPDGGLDIDAFLKVMGEPNLPIAPEPVLAAEVKMADMPFLRQWLETPTAVTKRFPAPDEIIISGDKHIEWVFRDGEWKPQNVTGKFMQLTTDPGWLAKSEIYCINDKGNKTAILITGRFRLEYTEYTAPSCDINGDDVVNLFEYADWAKTWKGMDQ